MILSVRGATTVQVTMVRGTKAQTFFVFFVICIGKDWKFKNLLGSSRYFEIKL